MSLEEEGMAGINGLRAHLRDIDRKDGHVFGALEVEDQGGTFLLEKGVELGVALQLARNIEAVYRRAFSQGQAFAVQALMELAFNPEGLRATVDPEAGRDPWEGGYEEWEKLHLLQRRERAFLTQAFHRLLLAYWRKAAALALDELRRQLGLEGLPEAEGGELRRLPRDVLRGTRGEEEVRAFLEGLEGVEERFAEFPASARLALERKLAFVRAWFRALLDLQAGLPTEGGLGATLWKLWRETLPQEGIDEAAASLE